jgi:hypothetical protein
MPTQTIIDIQKSRLSKMGKNGDPKEIESLKDSLKTLESLKARIQTINSFDTNGGVKKSEKELTLAYSIPDGDIHTISATSAQGLFRKICKDLTGIEPVLPAMAMPSKSGQPKGTFNFKGNFNQVLNIIRESGCVIKALPDLG